MKKSLAVFLVWAPIAGAAFAQSDRLTGIEESTDPAKVAEVERKAQEIISHQQQGASGASDTAGTSASSGKMHKKSHKARTHKMDKGSKAGKDAGADSGSTKQ
jgi:hypothetical protein